MTVERANALSLRRTVAASPEEAFTAWTHPDHLRRWSCPDPTAEVDVAVDLRVGGAYTIRMGIEGGPYTAQGIYREIDAPHRLVYTWDWKEGDHRMNVETVVTVEFVSVEGGTEVRLTHEGFPSEEAKAAHLQGWTPCVERLAQQLAG